MSVAKSNAWQLNGRPLALPVAVFLLCISMLSGCAGNDKKISWTTDKPSVTAAILDIQTGQQQQLDVNHQQDEQITELGQRLDRLATLNQAYQLQQAQIVALSAQLERMQQHKTRQPVIRSVKKKQKPIIHRTTPVLVPQLPAVPAPVVIDKTAQLEA
ncbi:MAG: hypothetical protein R8K50_08150, partial [Mariprofundus sp.]